MLRQVIVLGVDEARALHDSGKNHRASLLAEVVGIVLDVAVAVDFGARPPACPLFGGRAHFTNGVCTLFVVARLRIDPPWLIWGWIGGQLGAIIRLPAQIFVLQFVA